MDQAFVLPMPHATRRIELDNSGLNLSAKIPGWRSLVDQLSEKKISWEECLKKLPLTACLAPRLSTTKEHQSLLHLAVLDNRVDLIFSLLSISAHLRFCQNKTGFTPLELAQFLPRQEAVIALGGQPGTHVRADPHVEVSDEILEKHLSKVQHLSNPVFASAELMEHVLTQTDKAKKTDQILSEKIWMGVYFDEELKKQRHPQVVIRWVHDEVGLGVFAKQKIPPCAFVGEYTGVIETKIRSKNQSNHYCTTYPTWEMKKRHLVLNAQKQGNFTRLINHSAHPNIAMQSIYWRGMVRLIFVALTEISEGMQLTFDYGKSFWKDLKKTPRPFES